MKKLKWLALLPALLILSSCKKEEKSYSNVKILTVKLVDMPFLDGNNAGWDPMDGPDVFFKIFDPSNNLLKEGQRVSDIGPGNLPLGWNLTNAMLVTNLQTQYTIEFHDYDMIDPNDYIGGYYFRMQDHKTGYPKTITLESSNSEVKIELGVEWY